MKKILIATDGSDSARLVGHGALASALLGSVSRGVLHEACRSVLVVRNAYAGAELVTS
jgi:nucleotide-binding universal stress UspA family protein